MEFPREAIWSRAFVCRKFYFFITDSISLLMIVEFRLSVSPWFSFGALSFYKLSISSRLSSFLANNYSYILFLCVCFCNISCYFCHLSFLILCGSFLFSSYWACPEVYQFRLYFQRTSFWFYLFFLLFFKLLLFFLFDRFTSFLLLTLSFVFFPNSFRW